MNNAEKIRLERERIKVQRQAFKARQLIRDQKEKEKEELEIKLAFEQSKIKKPIEKDIFNSFSSISVDKLKDTTISNEVSLSDMMGIKKEEFINSNEVNEVNVIVTDKPFENADEKDRHYATDFM
jgi:hypothetical protein